MLVVADPKLKSQFLVAPAQNNLVTPWLVSGAELEMDRAVRTDPQIFPDRDDPSPIEGFDANRLSRAGRRILNRDVDRLIVP